MAEMTALDYFKAQDFLEKCPNALLEDDGMPLACPDKPGYLPQDYGCNLNCESCWNQPLEVEG